MAQFIDRNEVQRLVNEGAQLVEVLPAEDFKWGHLPGAQSIPLKTLGAKTTAGLDQNRPVIVYCHDFQ